MSALGRLEARDAAACESAASVLAAVAADLRLCGSLTRDTIRRVCSAVHGEEAQPHHREQGHA